MAKKRAKRFFKSWLDFLTLSLIIGIIILSIGIYLVGIHFPKGNVVLMLGSLIVYVTVIVLAFKI